MSGARVDVLIVTALKEELDAVLELELDGQGRSAWKDDRDQSGFPFHHREFRSAHGEKLRMAAAWSGEMGSDAAAARAVALILELNPECLAMCGICAGRRGKVFLGDVIVADRVFSYETGKHVSGGDGQDTFFHDITTYNLEATWKMDAAYFAEEFQKAPRLTQERPLSKESQRQWLLHRLEEHEREEGPAPVAHPERKKRCPEWAASIQALRKAGLIADTPGELRLTEKGRQAVAEARLLDPEGQEKDAPFRVHVAPIATGSAVREEPGLFDRLSRHVRKVLGAEMEARAIGFTAEQLGRRRSLIVKAVSDYADHDKDDAYRAFACHASAAFLVAFLQKHLRPQRAASLEGPTEEELPELEPGEAEEPDQHEEFLSHVERACVLRHPQGTRFTRRQGPPPFGTFLEVEVPEGRFVRVFPLAAMEEPITEEVLQAFLDSIHADYQRLNPAVQSTLVHAGASAPEELARKAHSRSVWLTSFGEYQGLFDFSAYLQRQTARLEGDPIYPPSLYVEQRARVSIGGQEGAATKDVLSTLRELLDSPHPRFALVLGDFGTGKTFLLHELARRMASEQAPLVPVLIEMRSLQKHRSLKALIAQHFAAADVGRLEPDQFLYMLQEGRIALLFDGFDELALRVTYEQVLEHFGTLIEATQGQAKVIVTSRTQHFLKDHDVKRELGERAAMLPGYRLIKLERFSEEQVRRFLEKRLGSAEAADERMALLRDVRDLLGLSENPRLLGFIAELDADSLRAARARSGEITSAKLYGLLIQRWLEGEHHRVNPSGAPKGLSVPQLRRGATELAMLLWERTERTVEIQELPAELITTVKAHGEHALEEGVIRHQLGSGSLLVRDEDGRFSFIHHSVLEWLVADAAAQAIREDKEAGGLGRREMSDLMADFFIDLAGPKAATAWAEARLGSGESEVAQKNALRLKRRLQETRPDEPHAYLEVFIPKDLEGKDLRGEDLTGADLRRANLRGANLAGVTLVGANLSGARLVRANLSRANLERANLQGADLTGAELSGARLLGADLRGATLQWARLRGTKLVGARVDSLEGAELFGAALPVPTRVTPNGNWTSPVDVVAFHPSGELLATAHSDGTLGLWDVETGQALRSLELNTRIIHALAFSPDGKVLASGSQDGTVHLWSVEQGTRLRIIPAHRKSVLQVKFSADGLTLLSGSMEGQVRRWSMEQGALLHTLEVHRGVIASLAFSPDGRTLAWGSHDGEIQLWNMEQPKLLRTLRVHRGAIRGLAFSSGGQRLASSSHDGTVRVWNIEHGSVVRSLKGQTSLTRSVAFGPDGFFGFNGHVLALGGDNGTVRLWSVDTGAILRTLQGHKRYVRSVVFSPNGRMLASGSHDGTVSLGSVELGVPLRILQGHTTTVRSGGVSPDARILAVCLDDGVIRLWNTQRTGGLRMLQGSSPLQTVVFSPDARMLAAGAQDGALLLCSVENEVSPNLLVGHSSAVRSVGFSASGRMLVSGSEDGTVRLWDVETRALVRTFQDRASPVRSVAVSPQRAMLAVGTHEGTVDLWDVESGTHLRALKGGGAAIRSLVFSPDGQVLAMAGPQAGALQLWDVERGALRPVPLAPSEVIQSLAFSPDGKLLAAGNLHGGGIQLWSLEQNKLVHSFNTHQADVLHVAFSRDGRVLSSMAADGSVRFWNASSGSLLATCLVRRDGVVAFRPDGHFKTEGEGGDAFWHSIGLCRFEPGELDPYLPQPLRLADDEPLLPRA